jgi:hypothetical protein
MLLKIALWCNVEFFFLLVYKYRILSFHGENIGSIPIRDNLAYNYDGYFESQVKRVFWFTWKFDHLKKDSKVKKHL